MTITRLAPDLARRGDMEEAKQMQSQARDVILEVKRRREEAKRRGVTAVSGGTPQACTPLNADAVKRVSDRLKETVAPKPRGSPLRRDR